MPECKPPKEEGKVDLIECFNHACGVVTELWADRPMPVNHIRAMETAAELKLLLKTMLMQKGVTHGA